MTTRSVRSVIQQSMRLKAGQCSTALITGAEARKIDTEIKKGAVVVGELKEAGAFYESGVTGPQMTRACPETSADTPVFSAAADKTFNKLFVQYNVPYGQNAAPVRELARAAIDRNGGLGDALATRPDTKKLHPVKLHDDRPVDGDKQTAWVDMGARTFHVQREGDFRGVGHVDDFHGPFSLDGGPDMHTMMVPEHPGDDSVTLAIPENPGDDGFSVTLAVPENPGDGAFNATLAFPENPGDATFTE